MPTSKNEKVEEPPELSEEDERILDEIWDKMGEEEKEEN